MDRALNFSTLFLFAALVEICQSSPTAVDQTGGGNGKMFNTFFIYIGVGIFVFSKCLRLRRLIDFI